MTFAINLKASGSTAAVTRIWDIVGAMESSPSMASLNYPPHLTLARYDMIDIAVLRRGVDSLAGEKALSVRFDCISIFENEPLVLYLQPAPLAALTKIHQRIHALIDPDLCDPHYQPGRWIPHCTLGTKITAESQAAARQLAAAPFEPFAVTFDTTDCVSFPPVSILREHRFGG